MSDRKHSGGRRSSGGRGRRDEDDDYVGVPLPSAGVSHHHSSPAARTPGGGAPRNRWPKHGADESTRLDGSPAARGGRTPASKRKPYFPPLLNKDEIVDGLSSGRLLLGFLRINAKKFSEGYVPVAGVPIDIYIDGDMNRNRALDGDIVVVELEDDSGWKSRKKLATADDDGTTTTTAAGSDDYASSKAAERRMKADVDALAAALDSSLALDPDSAPALSGTAAANLTKSLWQPIYAVKQSASGGLNVPDVPASVARAAGDAVSAAVTEVNGKALPPQIITAIATKSYREFVNKVAIATKGATEQPRARVMGIVVPVHTREVIGVLRSSDLEADINAPIPITHSCVRLVPTDKRLPFVIIPRTDVFIPEFFTNPAQYATRLFAASISSWTDSSRQPLGILKGSLGEAGEVATETRALLDANGLTDAPFSAEVMDSLKIFQTENNTEKTAEKHSDGKTAEKNSMWKIPAAEFETRRDYRAYRIMTIDPTTAKDLDDAVHVIPLGDDVYEVGVHIADVSYFIPMFSALDYEARNRCTSVYLVQRVIPMLPPLLCEQLCSLNPGVDRLAFSCVWKMRGNGELLEEEPWYGRTIIRSVAKLDYVTAQRLIDGEITDAMLADPDSIPAGLWDPLRKPGVAATSAGSGVLLDEHGAEVHHSCAQVAADVRCMHAIAMARRRKRFEAGALSLNKTKLVMKLDAEGNPAEVTTYPIKDSNKMIEEYMLLANYLVAQKLIAAVGKRAVLRCHPPIMEERAGVVKTIAKDLGLELDLSSASSIHNSLLAIYKADPEAGRVIEYLATKHMKPAQYFAAGAKDAEKWPHYALAIPYYTHFTSPIRRYADVMVHRLLAEALGEVPSARLETFEQLDAQCTRCNEKKKASKDAQDRSDLVYLTIYLRDHPVETEAVVCDIGGDKFITVVIPRFDIERKIQLDKIGWKGTFNEKRRNLVITKASAAPATPATPTTAMPSKRQLKDIAKWCVAHPTDAAVYGVTVPGLAARQQLEDVEAQVVGLVALGDSRIVAAAEDAAIPTPAVKESDLVELGAEAVIFPSDFSKAGKSIPAGATATSFNAAHDSVTLEHMSKLRVRLVGVTTTVPIDIDLQVLELIRI